MGITREVARAAVARDRHATERRPPTALVGASSLDDGYMGWQHWRFAARSLVDTDDAQSLIQTLLCLHSALHEMQHQQAPESCDGQQRAVAERTAQMHNAGAR